MPESGFTLRRCHTVIKTTRSHLFWNQTTRHWTKAGTLKYDTHLHTPSGVSATVLDGWTPKVTTGWMWDLTITNDHDFYIETAVKTILVHNVNADDGSSCGEASAAGSSGPLGDDVAATFRGGRYTARTLDQDTTFYRAGVAGKPLGQFFSEDAPVGEIQTRIDKAIPPAWPDGAPALLDTGYAIQVPKGVTVYEGDVANQGGLYMGGTRQVFIPKPWENPAIKVLGSWPLR